MDADLDTLATALYVRVDDVLKTHPERAPWRPAVGIPPKISDAELVTLAVMAALLGYTSEARLDLPLSQMVAPGLPAEGNPLSYPAIEAFLLDQQHWPGTGKWLGRRLLDETPDLHARLIEAHRSVICVGEVEPLRVAAMGILDCAGGWLQEGYLGYGEMPAARE